jgi:hypothetical protein
MIGRKLDTSTGAGGAVAVARNTFDTHLNGCADCQPHLCHQAEQLWRTVCLTALKQQHAGAGGTLAAVLAGGTPAEGHPADGAAGGAL